MSIRLRKKVWLAFEYIFYQFPYFVRCLNVMFVFLFSRSSHATELGWNKMAYNNSVIHNLPQQYIYMHNIYTYMYIYVYIYILNNNSTVISCDYVVFPMINNDVRYAFRLFIPWPRRAFLIYTLTVSFCLVVLRIFWAMYFIVAGRAFVTATEIFYH